MNLLCPICYNNMDTKEDEIHTTSCGHIFHLRPCLETALKSTSLCPKCRKYNVKHFQLFFEHADEDDEVAAGGAGAVGGLSKDTEYLSKQIRQLERKLDNISTSVTAASSSKASTSSSLSATRRSNSTASYHRHESRGYNFYDNYFDSTEERDNRAIKKLKEENADLREIVEMERIVGMNNDKEIQNLKEEVRERNDLINLLQVQNDDLREEKMILESKAAQQPSKSSIDDLLKL